MRCFIAVALPSRIKKELAMEQAALKTAGVKASWPAPSSFHLTLSFFGEVSPGAVPDIQDRMAAAAAQVPCFFLKLGTLGVFPRPSRPRVIWAGLLEGGTELQQLHGHLVYGLRSVGLPMENQKFSPHITLARIKMPVSGRRIQGVLSRSVTPRGFWVKNIHLYESLLTRSGAVHTSLGSSDLLPPAPDT